MLASDPAPSLNQKVSLLGIPNDSIRSGNALAATRPQSETQDLSAGLRLAVGFGDDVLEAVNHLR
jgi:hypothetical protein